METEEAKVLWVGDSEVKKSKVRTEGGQVMWDKGGGGEGEVKWGSLGAGGEVKWQTGSKIIKTYKKEEINKSTVGCMTGLTSEQWKEQQISEK